MSATSVSKPGAIGPPEPDLTSEEMIARAVALRPLLIERQAEVEERTFYSEEMHQRFLDAGFYRLYVPRRYGGYEFDVTTFARVAQELSRGCVSTGWCVALGSGHALQVGSWFPESAQAEIFGDGDFRAACVAAPVGMATRGADGWTLNGKVSYASGIPYSTHYMGQALTRENAPEGGEPRPLLFVAARDQFTRLDDWGNTLGLKGSGSHSITFSDAHLPANWVLEDTNMVDIDVSEGTPGLRLHGNPLYGGRAGGPFTITLAAILVGAAYNALDELENLMRTKVTFLPPQVLRMYDDDSQRWFGETMARIALLETAVHGAAQMHMDICRRAVEQGIPFSYEDDLIVAAIAREAMLDLWQLMALDIFRAAGSSGAVNGSRLERVFRDMSMIAGHGNSRLREHAHRELARMRFGLPPKGATIEPQAQSSTPR
jgi:3-hydroxy-9,10-secoandrosta-1,3,5(10)-triene-9,17-dione monooxygenase